MKSFSSRSKPLKRTKSVTKLERCNKRDSSILRSSRSHESLLSTHSTMTAIGKKHQLNKYLLAATNNHAFLLYSLLLDHFQFN